MPEAATAQGNSPSAKTTESPFACNRLALTPEQRKRHFDELAPKRLSLKKSVREPPNGYEFEFAADPNTVQLVADATRNPELRGDDQYSWIVADPPIKADLADFSVRHSISGLGVRPSRLRRVPW
jgi:hypothetical protein